MIFLRSLFRSGPKYFIAGAILLISIGGFCCWLLLRHTAETPVPSVAITSPKEDLSEKLALIDEKIDSLILVDNSLYDIETGELLFSDWLKGGMPLSVSYDRPGKKIIARYEKGFALYSLDGTQEAALAQRFPPAYADDLSFVVYAKDKDLWRAEIDWKSFQFRGDRKLTTIEQFNEQNFAANILMGTDKVIIVRNLMKLLRVDLNSGEVKPTRIPLGDFGKRRSPSGRYLVGVDKAEFYCFDVESDALKSIPLGRRTGFGDFQWLSEDRCAMISGGESVVVYDRLKNAFSEPVQLPAKSFKIGEPSPDGRFVFCLARGSVILVDLIRKNATQIDAGDGLAWIENDAFVFSREVPDSSRRGTWLIRPGQSQKLVGPSPYLVTHAGPMVLHSADGTVVFATKHGLSRMRRNAAAEELLELPHPPARAVTIGSWSKG